MILPDPIEIKKQEKQTETEARERISDLAGEEAKLANKLNETRENARYETEQIKLETDKFIEQQTERKNELLREIGSLESIKREALKPVEPIIDEAEATLAKAKEKEKLVEDREIQVGKDEEKNQQKSTELDDREKEILAKETALHDREKKIVEGEEKLKADKEQFVKDKELQKVEVEKTNKTLEEKKKLVDDQDRVNQIRQGEQDARDKALDIKKIKIADERATLDSAWKEFNSLKNKKS